MRSRIISLVSLAAKRKILPKEVLSQPHLNNSIIRKKTKFSSKVSLSKVSFSSPAHTSLIQKFFPMFSQSTLARNGLFCQAPIAANGGIVIPTVKRPVVISRKRKRTCLTGTQSSPSSPSFSSSPSSFSSPSSPSLSDVSSLPSPLFQEIDMLLDGPNTLILSPEEDAQLEKELRSLIPEYFEFVEGFPQNESIVL